MPVEYVKGLIWRIWFWFHFKTLNPFLILIQGKYIWFEHQAWHGLLVSKIQELQVVWFMSIKKWPKSRKPSRYRSIPPVPKIQEELVVFTGITGNIGGRARPGASFIGTKGAVCHRLESSDCHNTFDDIGSVTISFMLDDTQIYFPRFITLNAESEHTVNREICAEKKLSGMQKLCIFWYLSLNFFTMAYSKAKKVLWPEICKIFMERSFPLFQ